AFGRPGGEVAALPLGLEHDERPAAGGEELVTGRGHPPPGRAPDGVLPGELVTGRGHPPPGRAPDGVLPLAPEGHLGLDGALVPGPVVVDLEADDGGDVLRVALRGVDRPVGLHVSDLEHGPGIGRAARTRQGGEDEHGRSRGSLEPHRPSFYRRAASSCRGGGAATGIAIRKRAPGPSGSSSRVPPWSSTKRRATARPRPVPPFLPRVTKGSK